MDIGATATARQAPLRAPIPSSAQARGRVRSRLRSGRGVDWRLARLAMTCRRFGRPPALVIGIGALTAFTLFALSSLLDWPSGGTPGLIRPLGEIVIALFLLVLLARWARERVSREAALAAAEERRRLARELHDGVAQDLAFIVSQSLRLTRRFPDEPALERIAEAAERGLADSRMTINGLARPESTTLATAVCEQAHEMAERAGLRLELEVADGIQTTAEIEHAVMRISREAISNAARHADATTLAISVSSTADGLRVRVADDGRGFDPARMTRSGSAGFGLLSMDERARALGGEMRLESRPGAGTVVELALP
jgi:signal transduction histidine kinase